MRWLLIVLFVCVACGSPSVGDEREPAGSAEWLVYVETPAADDFVGWAEIQRFGVLRRQDTSLGRTLIYLSGGAQAELEARPGVIQVTVFEEVPQQ